MPMEYRLQRRSQPHVVSLSRCDLTEWAKGGFKWTFGCCDHYTALVPEYECVQHHGGRRAMRRSGHEGKASS